MWGSVCSAFGWKALLWLPVLVLLLAGRDTSVFVVHAPPEPQTARHSPSLVLHDSCLQKVFPEAKAAFKAAYAKLGRRAPKGALALQRLLPRGFVVLLAAAPAFLIVRCAGLCGWGRVAQGLQRSLADGGSDRPTGPDDPTKSQDPAGVCQEAFEDAETDEAVLKEEGKP